MLALLGCFAALAISAPLQEPAARTLAQRYKAGDESNFVFEQDKKRIGEHASRYLGQDELAGRTAHHFEGRIRLEAGAMGELRSSADLWLDDSGHLLRYTQQHLVGEAYSRVEVSFADGKAAVHVVQGPSARELSFSVDPQASLLANNFISHIEIALATRELGAETKVPMISATTLKPFTYKLTADGTAEVELEGAHKTAQVFKDSLGERLRIVDGRLFDIEVASQKLLIRRSDEKLVPFTIAPPEVQKSVARFDGEDVRIQRGEAVIAGRVTKPKGAEGRLPAVFFISGSGAQDRNGMSSGLDLGTHEILDRLTNDGFLVLRVDDRGAGESSPPPPNTSYLDLVADARACVEFLQARKDVDPARIALVGHSEGGETAPILAAELKSIAAVALMAAPGRSLLAIITEQNRRALELAGVKGDELEKQLKEVVELLQRVCSDAPVDPRELPEDQRSLLENRAWLQSHAKQDPIATIQKLRCPVLILQGAKDFQVSAERDARALEAALKAAQHPDHELVEFAGLDHLFKKSPGEKSELADYAKNRPIDAGFLDVLSAWLKKRLAPEKR